MRDPRPPWQSYRAGSGRELSLPRSSLPSPTSFCWMNRQTISIERAARPSSAFSQTMAVGAVVVSHDRELLEVMDAIVELTSLGATRYGGPWSQYRERKALELAAARHDLANAEKRVVELSRSAQATAERKARKDRAGKRKSAKGDMPRINLGRMKDQSEATSGENVRLVERRRAQAGAAVSAARERIEILQPLSIVLPSTGLSGNKSVLEIKAATVGYEPNRPIIRDLSFAINGPERVAVTGPNGSGKTTLLGLIVGMLEPWAGTVRTTTRFAMLDQRVSLLQPSASIRDNFRRLNPGADENACRAALAKFMFRADAALQIVSNLSGGQTLRAGLACALAGSSPPPFIILDEPTNHWTWTRLKRSKPGCVRMTALC
jgi:ATPase subunit of ABC transporter with duplicated ATPase domains